MFCANSYCFDIVDDLVSFLDVSSLDFDDHRFLGLSTNNCEGIS